eukprot:TRINITY_DN8509_c0_g1_i1.p1 TRINITY_DN8509_c0_g1~~TRINITY_DN8509_c0_g1_i1.p1  ORF type:complete len:299 (+),score=44.97 TRINITY_DN8509_c0_g1_i1:154-1050(+)
MDLQNLLIDLRPTDESKTQAKATIRKLVTVLKDKLGVPKIVKGGSLGKGTSRDRFDVDLVVFFNDYVFANHSKYLDTIEACLRENFADLKVTKRKYSLLLSLGGLEVDLLCGGTISENPADAARAFLAMTAAERQTRSASVTEIQRNFIRKHPAESSRTKYKDLVRLAKCWRDEQPTLKDNVSSYSLELIMMHALDSVPANPQDFKTVFQQFLGTIAVNNVKIIFEDHYTATDIPPEVRNVPTGLPLIMDPANPTNNVGQRLNDVWPQMVSSARAILDGHPSPKFAWAKGSHSAYHLY